MWVRTAQCLPEGCTVIYTSTEGAHLALPGNYHPCQKNTHDKDDNHLSGNHLLMSYIISLSSNRTIITNHYFVLNWVFHEGSAENFSGVKLQRIQPKIAKKECLQGARANLTWIYQYLQNQLVKLKALLGSGGNAGTHELLSKSKLGLGPHEGWAGSLGRQRAPAGDARAATGLTQPASCGPGGSEEPGSGVGCQRRARAPCCGTVVHGVSTPAACWLRGALPPGCSQSWAVPGDRRAPLHNALSPLSNLSG